jgi:hypothetical protein
MIYKNKLSAQDCSMFVSLDRNNPYPSKDKKTLSSAVEELTGGVTVTQELIQKNCIK